MRPPGPRFTDADLSRTGEKELIDVITQHTTNESNPSSTANGRTHAERVTEALGSMFMEITCSHCGSDKVIRAGACGVAPSAARARGAARDRCRPQGDALSSGVINDIRDLVAARPFVPFTIHLVDGGGLHVPTIDHVHVAPSPERVFVWHHNGKYDTIRPLMISRVTVDREAASSDS